MDSQLYERLYGYITEYQELVNDFYSKDSVAFLITYYNLDTPSTVWDNDTLMGGAYERIGEYSGIKWNKIQNLPVFQIDEISTVFDAQDIGYIKDNKTTFVIPATYNITPRAGDFLKLDQSYLRPSCDIYPIFIVKGIEISSNTDKRFWKITVENEQSRTIEELDQQLNGTYSFLEYTKLIYTFANKNCMSNLIDKSQLMRDNLSGEFDNNSGFYLIKNENPLSIDYDFLNYSYPTDLDTLKSISNLEKKNKKIIRDLDSCFDNNSGFYLIEQG